MVRTRKRATRASSAHTAQNASKRTSSAKDAQKLNKTTKSLPENNAAKKRKLTSPENNLVKVCTRKRATQASLANTAQNTTKRTCAKDAQKLNKTTKSLPQNNAAKKQKLTSPENNLVKVCTRKRATQASLANTAQNTTKRTCAKDAQKLNKTTKSLPQNNAAKKQKLTSPENNLVKVCTRKRATQASLANTAQNTTKRTCAKDTQKLNKTTKSLPENNAAKKRKLTSPENNLVKVCTRKRATQASLANTAQNTTKRTCAKDAQKLNKTTKSLPQNNAAKKQKLTSPENNLVKVCTRKCATQASLANTAQNTTKRTCAKDTQKLNKTTKSLPANNAAQKRKSLTSAENNPVKPKKRSKIDNDDDKKHGTKTVKRKTTSKRNEVREFIRSNDDDDSSAQAKHVDILDTKMHSETETSNEKNLVKTKNIKSATSKAFSASKTSHGKGKVQKNDSSSEESEWEDVEEACEEVSLANYKPDIPKEGVQVTLDVSQWHGHKRKRQKFDFVAYLRRHVNRFKKDLQLSLHKVHLLCLLAHGLFVNDVLKKPLLKALALSVIPAEMINKCKRNNLASLESLLEWYYSLFTLGESQRPALMLSPLEGALADAFETRKTTKPSHYVFILVAIARTLKLDTRLCFSLYPLPLKPTDLLKAKPKSSSPGSSATEEKISEKNSEMQDINPDLKAKNNEESASVAPKNVKKSKNQTPRKKSKMSKAQAEASSSKEIRNNRSHTENANEPESKMQYSLRPRSSKSVKEAEEANSIDSSDYADDESSDDDFVIKRPENFAFSCKNISLETHNKTIRSKTQKNKKRKVFSSDSDEIIETSGKSKGVKQWLEIFVKSEGRWMCVDPVNKVIDKPYEIESRACQPVKYVVCFNNKSKIKDVTKRYASDWMTSTRKSRVNEEWWNETLKPFAPPENKQERDEEQQLKTVLMEKPLPATIGEYKNHPLYALKRHLLKYEAIYPPDAPPLGFIQKEPVYARECVHTVHPRETWLKKQARMVKLGEKPYKIVKARPKWDKFGKRIIKAVELPPLEVFGFWQTEPYVPPEAKDGKVPRNEYGNVELFQPSMLPKGTVHIQLPGLSRVAKKLGIDCAPAVVRFEGSAYYGPRAVYDGWVVCKEFKEVLVAAWEEEQENIRKREQEKKEKRVYGNWKRLVRGLLIRERLKLKYSKDHKETK